MFESLTAIWLTSSIFAVGYDWLCAPEQFIEVFRGRHRASSISLFYAVVVIFIGGPVALIAMIIYHGKWR